MNTPVVGKKVQFPSRVLCFKNIFNNIDINNDSIHEEIYDDIRDECAKYGRIMTIVIPKNEKNEQHIFLSGDTFGEDATIQNNLPGVYNAYVEFYTLDESKEARRVRLFS